MALVPLEEVQRHVWGAVAALPPVEVPLAEAAGRVLAEDVVAAEPVPPFANSAMDGYAVRAADCAGAGDEAPVRLRVVGDVRAGVAPDRPVGPGEAIRIMTGAPVPDGADGIVIVEHTTLEGDDGSDRDVVVVRAPAGDHIRAAGGDMVAGDLVFRAGTLLGSAHVGVLAGLGRRGVQAVRRPRVGVMATGDELTPPGEPLAPGKIRESNRPMLLAQVAEAGCEPVDFGIVEDREEALAAAVGEATAACDALVTSGGVSVGDYDFVKVVLERLGEMRWFQVAIKPAKPFAFGLVGGRPVFGLPGNPVSSFVSFELFARPALRRMLGDPHPQRPVAPAVAEEPLARHPDGKTHFARVVVRRDGDTLRVRPAGAQVSNVLTAMAYANALAVVPDGDGVPAGGDVEVMLLAPV